MGTEMGSVEEMKNEKWAGGEAGYRVATILYVEDERFVREGAREVMERAGYRVLAAGTAAEAMELYEKNAAAISLLLADVVLPGETGRALGEKLRERSPALSIVLATGYRDEVGPDKGWEQWLAKPFSSQTLLGRIQEALRKPS